MSGVYQDRIDQLVPGSNIPRIYPNAIVQLYISGTDTKIAEVQADSIGNFTVSSLSSGKYDIKVDGLIYKTIEFVPSDHNHNDRSLVFTKLSAITADQDEDPSMAIFSSAVAGEIVFISISCQSVDVTGDATIHILKGAANGSTPLTVSSDSEWQHRIFPGAATNRYHHEDSNPGITVSADESITIGIVHAANNLTGLTVDVIFRPN